MNKIPGPALCGFADHFDEDVEDLLGAKPINPLKPGKAPPTSAKGARAYPKAKQSSTVATHAQVLKNARKVLAKAHGQVKKAAQKTLAKPAPVRTTPGSRVAAATNKARVVVHGDEYVVVGASAVPAAQQPKVKAAQAKLAKARANMMKAKKVATEKTKAAHVTLTKLAQQVKAHENVARKMGGKGVTVSAPSGRRGAPPVRHAGGIAATHRVHGYIGDDAAGLYPGDQGYDPTTENGANGPVGSNPWDGGGAGTAGLTTDPNAAVDAGIDPNTGASTSPQLDVDTLVAAANAAGKVPPDQMIMDSSTWPIIKYDESKGRPDGCLLSYGLATRTTDIKCEPDTAGKDGNAHFGYVWKTYPQKKGIDGIYYGEDLGKTGWNHVHGRKYFGDNFSTNDVDPAEAYASYTKTVDPSIAAHVSGFVTSGPQRPDYGPLVGNPAPGNPFNGARVDANGVVFWIANEAPDWLTAPLKAAAALTKAAADKAAKDAAAADAAAAAKLAADNAAALAAQQAQNALDEANAASQGRQATSQAQGVADQADAAAAQAEAQYSQADAAQAQADAAAAAQQYQQDAAERQWEFQQAQQQAQQDQQYAQQQAPLDLQQQQWEFQQAQRQADLDFQFQQQQLAQQAQQAQFDQQQQAQQQYAPQPQQYDEGGGGGGGDDTFDPEGAADVEAANIEADADVLGRVLGQPTIAGDEAVVGGDGEVIGLDQWGNATE